MLDITLKARKVFVFLFMCLFDLGRDAFKFFAALIKPMQIDFSSIESEVCAIGAKGKLRLPILEVKRGHRQFLQVGPTDLLPSYDLIKRLLDALQVRWLLDVETHAF